MVLSSFIENSHCFYHTGSCSLIAGKLNTFDDKTIELTDYTRVNCSVLLAADCSISPKFALFVTELENSIFKLTLHVNNDTYSYTPRADGKDFLVVNGDQDVEIISEVIPIGTNDNLR